MQTIHSNTRHTHQFGNIANSQEKNQTPSASIYSYLNQQEDEDAGVRGSRELNELVARLMKQGSGKTKM